MSKIEKEVEDLVKPKIESIGYELYDVLYIKEGSNRILRIVIDSDNGISLDDCEKVNNEIKEIIDSKDPIKEQYFLEISSPGIERVLRKDEHLNKNIGNEIYVKLFQKDCSGNKEYYGILKQFTNTKIIVETDGLEQKNEVVLERKNIAQIKTVYHWQ